MKLIDTHTHLFVDSFDKDRNDVIQSAINSGIEKMILPGINSSLIPKQTEIVEKFKDNCYAAIGLHPSDVKDDYEIELKIIKEKLLSLSPIAVGEIGIDLYWDKTYKVQQQDAFEKQIIFAKESELPIIIHVRDSFDEVFEIVDKHNDESLRGIFHSFTGNIKQSQKIIDYGGFKIGINGIVTFKNSGLDKIVKEINIKHLVIETDSPWLAPVPKRGKRNESSYLIHTAEKIAEIKQIRTEELADITSQNACEIFGDKLKLN